MDSINNLGSSMQYRPIPAVGKLEKFDTGDYIINPKLGGAGDGVISLNEMERVLNDPEKKAEFLSAIISEVDRFEKRGYGIDRLIALQLKQSYFDIVTGKIEKQAEEDTLRLFEILRARENRKQK
jgi:predicted HTH transcriptional regulator